MANTKTDNRFPRTESVLSHRSGPGRSGLLIGLVAILLGAVVAFTAPSSPASAADPIKITPVGDSLTQGIIDSAGGGFPPPDQQAGYRDRLEERILASGAALDFVGREVSGGALLDDPHHEGVKGNTIQEIQDRVVPWLTTLGASAPDVVLLIAGTNDVTDSPEGTTDPPPADTQPAAERLGVLVGAIAAAVPAAEIIVGTLPPHVFYNDRVASYNSQLPGIIATRAAAGDNVRLVNTGEVIVVGELEDAEHPGAFGYGKIADVWFRALVDSYPALAPTFNPPVATDDFDRADGQLGIAPTGQTWTSAVPAQWGILGNEASTTANTGERVTVLDVGQSNVSVSADVRLSPTAGTPSLSFRAASSNQYLLAGIARRAGVNQIGLFKRDAGVFTELGRTSGTGFIPGQDYRLRVEASGPLVQVWLDDVMWIQHTLSTADQTLFGSATAHGLRSSGSTSEDGGSRWDDFEIRPTAVVAMPSAPAAPTAVPGDGEVAVSWTAPAANGSPITGYTVTAAPGGATCTTSALSCTVNGLTNGTAYTFTVVATNAIGTSTPSAPAQT